LPSDHSLPRKRKGQNESERRIEETDELLQETVERLSRHCPPDLVGEAAHDDLLDLKPHFQDALTALADIERQRVLTDEELSQRRAFKMLLVAAR
jgi:hypothetical protein